MTGPHPEFLRSFAETRGFLWAGPRRIQVTPAGDAVLFLRSPPRAPDHDLYELDGGDRPGAAAGPTPPTCWAAQEEELSAPRSRRAASAMRITDRGFTWFALSPDGAPVLLPLSGRLFLLERGERRGPGADPAGRRRARSPVLARRPPDRLRARRRRVRARRRPDAGAPRRLTPGRQRGAAATAWRSSWPRRRWGASRATGGRPTATGWPSPRWTSAAVERFGIADPARPEQPPVRVPLPARRPGQRPGAPGPACRRPAATPPVWVNWDAERYPYLARVLWDSERAPLALLVQTPRPARGGAAGRRRGAPAPPAPLLVERDEAWVNLDRDLPRWLPDGSGLLWASERGGRRALELRDPTGARCADAARRGRAVPLAGAT